MSRVEFIGPGRSGAVFSECRTYRFSLWRRWEMGTTNNRMIAFCGLNPSTADEINPDPTITRLINYAKAWGYDGMCMLNLFAFRATDPAVMKRQADPIGPLNNDAIFQVVNQCNNKLICCWGNHGEFRKRADEVVYLLDQAELLAFKITKTGQPSHPLYLAADLVPSVWNPGDDE